MPRDGKSPCPPRRQGNAPDARPTALRPLPLSTGTFSAHTGPDWTTLPGVRGGGQRAAFCSRAVPAAVAPEVASGFVASFAGVASAWERLAKLDERVYPRVAAMHSWKQRTRQRYGSAIHQLAEFEACIPTKALPEVFSLCMAERAADGHSASGLRGLASAVRAAEDLALVPRVVAALHWRIAKSGRGPGPQAYVSPRALVHIWNAATAPDDRAVAALAALSWTMWLRVGEAASIRYCDLGGKEGLLFYSTKVGEPGWVCRPAAAYARSWMEFLRVYCKANGKRPDEPVFDGGGPFFEDAISRLLRDTKWADARWHPLRRGGSAACWVRKLATQYFLFWGRWAGLRTAMGYALGFRDPEVVGDLVLPHVGEAVGLGPRGTVLPAALWGLAMYDLSRFTEPLMEPPHPSPPPLLGHAGGSLVEDVPEEQGIADTTVDDPQSCPSPAVPEPLSEPRPTSPSPPYTQSASPELPLGSLSCPILTRMRMLEMGRGFVGLWSVCQIWGALLLRQMPSGLERPALGGLSPVSDPGNQDHGGSSMRPPPPVRQYRVPSPSRVGGPDAVVPTIRQQRLVPKRRSPEVTECPPRKRPAVGQGLAPGRGVSAPTGGNGGGGLWRPVFVMSPGHPRDPWGGRGPLRVSVWAPWLSAAKRLMPRPPPPPGPRVVAGLGCGWCASWSRVVGGGLGGGGWQWPGNNRRNKRWMWGYPRGEWGPRMPGDRRGRRPRHWKSGGHRGQ